MQLEEALLNIRIFEMVNRGQQGATIDQYLYKIRPLYVVKHPKFTSPSRHWQSSTSSLSAWLNPFHDDSAQYEGANCIF